MANEAIIHRRRIRQRNDNTAIHRSAIIDANNTTQDIKLDIVASKVSVSVPAGLQVDVDGSIDGILFFSMFTNLTGAVNTYGDAASEHLVKVVRITRDSGDGQVTIVGV